MASCCPGSPALLAAPPAFFGSSMLRLLSLTCLCWGFVLIIQGAWQDGQSMAGEAGGIACQFQVQLRDVGQAAPTGLCAFIFETWRQTVTSGDLPALDALRLGEGLGRC